MIRQTAPRLFLLLAGAGLALTAAAGTARELRKADRTALQAAIAAPARTAANVARDRYRHPEATLAFVGVRASDTVVEIWPSGGWYTEILAPYLRRGGGTYYAAAMGANGHNGMRRLMAANADLYGGIRLATFPAFEAGDTRVPDGSADVVLTFRNVHNFQMGYQRNASAP